MGKGNKSREILDEVTRLRELQLYFTEGGKPYAFDPQYYMDVFIDFLNKNPGYKDRVKEVLK